MENISLEKTYYDAENTGSFGGVSRLAEAARVPLKNARQWSMLEGFQKLTKQLKL